MLKYFFLCFVGCGIAWAQTDSAGLDEVVISGSLRPVLRRASAVPVQVLQRSFFRSNPGPNMFESIQMVNGLQPQVNCNVCSAGDIHINGMEGAYTLVTIDGMPMVSALGTVYGLMGIPNSLLERVEIIKGAASALYGPEAMAGVVNLITRQPGGKPFTHVEFSGSSHAEWSADVAVGYKAGRMNMLSSMHGFRMNRVMDVNSDGFADIPVQQRFSVFQKIAFDRKSTLPASLALRIFREYRRGGELEWEERFAGTDSVYGERIITRRTELLGNYRLGILGKPALQFSGTAHRQNSVYGTLPFHAAQYVGFMQLLWTWNQRGVNWLAGLPLRYTHYDDGTPATANPQRNFLPGVFIQAEGRGLKQIDYNLSLRTDIDRIHGIIWSPRLALKRGFSGGPSLRFNLGTAYRPVNVFTEDHAALTGARTAVFREELLPERAWSALLNFTAPLNIPKHYARLEAGLFHTRFSNKIVADYFSNPNQIIYANLKGFAISRGASLDADFFGKSGRRLMLGFTFMQVGFLSHDSNGRRGFESQIHSPPFSASLQWQQVLPGKVIFDLGAKCYSPMRLPVVPNDFRPEYSPWYALLNVQCSRNCKNGMEFFAGIRNLLNFVPRDPLLRSFDPFDKYIQVDNPQGYTFDTAYNYASMQGRRVFAGLRLML